MQRLRVPGASLSFLHKPLRHDVPAQEIQHTKSARSWRHLVFGCLFLILLLRNGNIDWAALTGTNPADDREQGHLPRICLCLLHRRHERRCINWKLRISVSSSTYCVSQKESHEVLTCKASVPTRLTATHSVRAKRICSARFCQLNALCCYFFAKLHLPPSFHTLFRKFIPVLAKYSFCRFTNCENMSISFSMSLRLSACPITTREQRDGSSLILISGRLTNICGHTAS